VLIEVTDVAPRLLVTIRCAAGQASVNWRGTWPPAMGRHHIEWTVDTAAEWGGNLMAAALTSPSVQMAGETVVLRGQLSAQSDDVAMLDLDGDLILLDLVRPLPPQARMAWAELRAPSSAVELYPYEL
jgi:hypothetical protein